MGAAPEVSALPADLPHIRARHGQPRRRHVSDRLIVRGAREHNLKDVSLEIPRNALVVFTGDALLRARRSSQVVPETFEESVRSPDARHS